MVASTVTIQSPPDTVVFPDGTDGILRPAITVAWTGGTGPFNVRYEWDTVNTFDSGSLITVTQNSVTSPDTAVPTSDLGTSTWYFRATVIDTGDSNAELASTIRSMTFTDPIDRDRYLFQQVNVGVAFDSKDSPLERQIIYNDATGGTFTLSFDGQGPTAAINYNDGGATIESELQGLSNITDVKVTALGAMIRGVANAWLVEFIDPGGVSEPLITANDTGLTGGTTTIFQYSDGGDWDVASPSAGTIGADGQNQPSLLPQFIHLLNNLGVGFDANQSTLGDDPLEVQCIYNDATGGTFTLSFDGQGPTAAINYNDGGATIESELQGLSNITDVKVTALGAMIRGVANAWLVEFIDPGGVSEPLITANDTGLTGDTIGTTIYQVFDGGDWDDSTTEGTIGPDGQVNPKLLPDFVHMQTNLGVGFDPTDGLDLGGDKLTPAATNFWPADGYNNPAPNGVGSSDLLNQYLHAQVNVTTTQPCPFIFDATPTVVQIGDSVVITGQGLVGASSPTADPYDAEVRIYESPDFGAAFVTATIVSYTNTDTLDTIVIQVPVGATNGHLAVVHTTTPSCAGSNFVFLEVVDLTADLDAGWWVEIWNIRGDERLIANVPILADSTYFQKIKNEIGSGWMEIPAHIPDPSGNVDNLVDIISNPNATPKVERQARVYLDGILRYGFFTRHRSDPYGEKGNKKVRISGPGRESVVDWMVAGRADEGLSNKIKNPDRVYGSTVNAVGNPSLEDGNELIENGGGEALEQEPWEEVGTASVAINQFEFRSGTASIRVSPSAVNDGTRQEASVDPGSTAFIEGWAKDEVNSGETGEFRVYYDDGGPIVLDSGTIALGVLWKRVQLEANIPTGVTTVYVEWRNTTGTQRFFIDDNTGIDSVSPWVARGSATLSLARDIVADGDNECKVVTTARNQGARQNVGVQPNTKYTFVVEMAGTVGETVRLRAVFDELAAIDAKTFAATNTYETFTVSGITGPEQTALRLDLQGREVSGQTFYFDAVTGTPGEPAASGGTIIDDIIDAGQLRGVLPFLQRDYTATLTSKGDAYDDPSLALAIRHDQSLAAALDQLVTFGLDWQVTDAYVLQLFNFLGTDLTQLADGVAPMLDAGKPIIGGSFEGENPRATFFHIEGADGITSSASRTDWETDLERREKWITNSAAADTVTLGKLGQAALDAEDARGLSIRLQIARAESIRPFVDFDVGDVINVSIPSDNDAATGSPPIEGAFRVIAIAVLLEQEGSGATYTVDLNRLEYERDAKEAAALARLLARGEERSGFGGDAGISSGSLGGSTSPSTSTPTTGETGPTSPHEHSFADIDDPSVGGDLGGKLPNPTVIGIRGKAVAPTAPTDRDSYVWNAAANRFEPYYSETELINWTDASDPLVVGAGDIEWSLPPDWATADILWAYARLQTAGSGGDTIIDVNKNGTTIFTTQANRPTFASTAKDIGATAAVPDVTTMAARDVLTVDVDQVNGSPARLVVSVMLGRTS